MGRSYLPRWKFTDSCGRPQRASGAIFMWAAPTATKPCALIQAGARS